MEDRGGGGGGGGRRADDKRTLGAPEWREVRQGAHGQRERGKETAVISFFLSFFFLSDQI